MKWVDYLFVILIFQGGMVAIIEGLPALPFLPTAEGEFVNDLVSRNLGLKRSSSVNGRRTRCLVPILTLLWPQVVGPMENGTIKEPDFKEVPKTLLENHLDLFKQHVQLEKEQRKHWRDYLHSFQANLQHLPVTNTPYHEIHPMFEIPKIRLIAPHLSYSIPTFHPNHL